MEKKIGFNEEIMTETEAYYEANHKLFYKKAEGNRHIMLIYMAEVCRNKLFLIICPWTN